MPPAKKKSAPRKKAAPRKKGLRKARDVPDFASLSVTRSIQTSSGTNYDANTLYNLLNVQLQDYDRAVTVSRAYQHYRIPKVTLKLKPTYDTFVGLVGGGGGAPITRPQIYYMIDKSGSIPTNVTLEALKQMGAKPNRFDERPFTISWRPSVLTAEATGPANAIQTAAYKVSPWLTTNANSMAPGAFVPSDVDHLGVYWYLEQVNSAGMQYTAEIEVQFQFKKPLYPLTTSVAVAITSKPAQINSSRDGIVDAVGTLGDDIELSA